MGKENNSRQKAISWMMFSDSVREIGVFVALIVVVIMFALINSSYMAVGNFVDIIKQVTIDGILAIGTTFAIISGRIDLSLRGTFAIAIIAVGQLTVLGASSVTAICAGMMLETFMGSINGLLITKMRLQPFIATLSTMSVFRGITHVITGGWPVLNIPDAYRKSLGAKVIGDVPISIFVLFAIAVIAHILLRKTRFGNYLFTVGGNEGAVKLSGVNVGRTKIFTYSMCGFCVAFVGMTILANPGTGESVTEQGYKPDTIAASAIGEARMAGGRGSILDTFLDVLLLAVLKIGLIITGVGAFWRYIATDIIIVIAACFEVIQSRLSSKFSKSQA